MTNVMNVSCYKYTNSRATKDIIFIENKDIIEIIYKVDFHWKNDCDFEYYTDSITISMDYFTKELLNNSPSISETYNISKKLTIIDKTEIKHKAILNPYSCHYYDNPSYIIKTLKNCNFTNKKIEQDINKINEFMLAFDYLYNIRREGQPKIENIDNIKEYSTDK